MGEMVMNPKDEVKFEDIKKLVNAALGKFYKNERDLIDMENNREMVSVYQNGNLCEDLSYSSSYQKILGTVTIGIQLGN